jgi:hypothetical protein
VRAARFAARFPERFYARNRRVHRGGNGNGC